ncbi:MAG: hypothetical protein ABI823_20035, partial [Bryobacteraceae bacterium]
MKTALLIVLALITTATAFADQIVLKNGDRVTGTIVQKADDAVTIKSAFFGTITLPWKEIESIKTETPLNVVLSDGKELKGNLATSDGKVEITAESGKQVVPSADVKTLRDSASQGDYERMLHPGWTNLWAGAATLGFAGTAGNAKTSTFTLGMAAARATRTDKMS